jgi:hypothetical protein
MAFEVLRTPQVRRAVEQQMNRTERASYEAARDELRGRGCLAGGYPRCRWPKRCQALPPSAVDAETSRHVVRTPPRHPRRTTSRQTSSASSAPSG